EESKESKVLISGGNVSVKISITGGTAANLAGAAIGNNLSPLSGSQIQIDGGVISISRMRGGTEMTVPIGPNGDFGKSPVINGGSIRASYDQDLTLGAPYVVFDSGGNSLMRYVVNLDIADDPQSLFVRRSGVLYPEYDNTERYADFHIQGKHKDLNTLGSYHQYYNLYLPEGSLTDPNHISLEYSSDGSVKTFSASGGSVTQTDTSKTFYRVVYRLGEKLRYEGDIVHIEDAVTFKQSIRAKNAYLNDVVAPWSLTYVERHDINYNDDAAVKDVTPLTGQYDYFASETPFILATGVATASTSYGNIEFNTAVSGRLVITAEDVKRVNVQYRDDYVYLEDPSVPVARQVDRVFGEGYPAIAVGLAKDGDTTTGPWALNGPPVATPLPEPADVIWTSDYFMFEYWRLNNAVSGMRYDTNDAYYIPAGSGDLTFHSVWEWKGRIYPAENGPGHIEYSLDGGTTWKTRTVTDAYGTFFPVPPQTVLLKAVPDAYAVFLQWGDAHGHVTGNDPAASVTVASTAYGDAKYATAWFHLETYRITTATSGDGSISPAGSVSAEAYEDKSFVITPMRDSSIIDVIVDGVSIGPVSSYTFWNIVSDHTIEVKFTLIPEYTITATGGEGVTVSPGGTVSVPIRNSHTVSWTAKLGYEVKDVAIDGLSHPELVKAGSYTFSNITSNHTIVVTAEKKHVFLTVNVEGKGGYVEYSLDGGWTFTTYTERLELIFGESPILRAVCEDGYMFVRWEGSRGGTNETIRIENISTDMTETSVFAEEGASDLSVLTIIGMTVGLSLMVVMAWVGGRVNIVMIDSDSAMIIGKKRARINQPYRFFVDFLEGEGFVTYRVGENKVWKEAIRDGGRYEIPPEDVTDTLTIKAR
ncbi:MAG: hypothetical protein FWC29_00850, partial [Methanomassiliicoccaceae archaeon]|nr:hypothetical protein [Methanomassiliicoccaceae archaeon]